MVTEAPTTSELRLSWMCSVWYRTSLGVMPAMMESRSRTIAFGVFEGQRHCVPEGTTCAEGERLPECNVDACALADARPCMVC